MTEPHDDIPYRSYEADYTGGPQAPRWAADRSAFDVDSPCPACRATTRKNVPRGLPMGNKGFLRRDPVAAPKVPERVTMICGCGYPHANRPPESTETGCGAEWKVPLQ